MKRVLALVMALCLLVGHLPATAWAAEEETEVSTEAAEATEATESVETTEVTETTEEDAEIVDSGTCGDDLTWTLDETGLLTISGTGEMTSAPWLADYAASITAVHMEPGITSIYDRAFSSCSNLTEVTIPEGVTFIGNSAFYGCLNLPELTLPQSLRTIGKSAFSDCDALTEIVIPEGVTEILLDTFAGCYRLASVTVPSTVTEIDQCAFLSCPSLKSFVFPEGIGIVEFELFMNCYTLESVSIPSSVCVIKACAFQDCDRLGEVTIPDCVFSIGDYAFYKSGLTALRVGSGGEVDRTLGSNTIPAIPDGIGRYSFSSCSYLEEVEIGPEINEIGEYAFACSTLTQCTFLGDIPAIDATAFTGVTATVYYPAGNATYTEETMLDYGGDLTWEAYEQTVEVIASGTCGDNLTWTLDETGLLTISGTGAMYDYEDPTQEDTTAGIAPWIEMGETITRLVVEEGVTYLGTYAFAYLEGLEEALLADSVADIGAWAFCGTGLTSVTLPASLSTLYTESFGRCDALTEFLVPEESAAFCSVDGVVYSKDKTTLVAYPSGRSGAFTIPEGTVTIGEYAFAETALTEVTMPLSVTHILEGAFCYNDNLAVVEISPVVEVIEAWAFTECTVLEEVSLPQTLSELGDYAFGWCSNLQRVYFNCRNIATVGTTPFEGVTADGYHIDNRYWTDAFIANLGGTFTWYALVSGSCGPDLRWRYDEQTGILTISGTGPMYHYAEGKWESAEGLEEDEECLPYMAPWGVHYFTQVVIEEGVTAIGNRAFEMMMDNAQLSLPSTLEKIGSYAFAENYSNTDLVLPEGLTYIGEAAFAGWEALTTLHIPDSVVTIGDGAFSACGSLQELVFGRGVDHIGDHAFESCGSLTQIQFTGDAPGFIGESAFSYVTATVTFPLQNDTWTEEIMQQYGGTLTWVAYGEAEETLFGLSGASVSLGDSLDMHFFIESANVTEDCYAVITRCYADGREDQVVTVPYSEWNTLEDGTLYVTYSGIAAKEMGDYMEVAIYNGSDEAISEVWVDSVKSYVMRMLGKEEVIANEELRTLYVDMLNYGAAAQAQFGYNVTMPANDLLTEEQQAYATASYETESNLVSGTGRAGTTLTLKSRITLDFIFSNRAIGTDHTGLYAIAAYTDHYGNAVEVRIDTIKTYSGSCSYVSVPGLAVADYGQAVTCTVYDAEGNALAWATDSMEGYAHRMAGKLPQIVDAIVKFGVSSYNYFH